jgi:asparagine synthase (glutamine-hydrolysing)
MCGLTGYLTPGGFEANAASCIIRDMSHNLNHRGPDDNGIWIDSNYGVAFGHQRLAVVDLSTAGRQPMSSVTEGFIIVFNGEIYNHRELRNRMPGYAWHGDSDTETILAGIENWGLKKTLQASVGMFALALWDKKLHTLSLARDRIGEKPLYYGWQGKSFLFSSELKSFNMHPDFRKEIDIGSLELYIRKGYVPSPYSIYQGISKLIPGSIITLSDVSKSNQIPSVSFYWQLKNVISHRSTNLFKGTPEEAVSTLKSHLNCAIDSQKMADVPVGAFLSGGIDSSTVVALMQERSTTPIHTFSIGFGEKNYDESLYARRVAKHLHTNHTELHVTASDALDVIPDLPLIYDEPFADVSQIPTILLSRLARQHVTVSLSGDGGDELFCGYSRYPNISSYWNNLRKIPLTLRSATSRVLPKGLLQEALGTKNLDEFYNFTNRQWKGFPDLVLGARFLDDTLTIPEGLVSSNERMMYTDSLDYLPNDILTKVDRAAMSCSLETRMPLLDHRVIEFAWSLPENIKFRQGVGKWPLKQVLYDYIPKKLIERPKMGFGVPLEHWLRGPLREWAESLLDPKKIESDGFFDPEIIQQEWARHLSKKKDRHYWIWTVLMFQAWLESQK